jgi:hypothetical protein
MRPTAAAERQGQHCQHRLAFARAKSQKAMFPIGIFHSWAVIRAASYLRTSATVAQSGP